MFRDLIDYLSKEWVVLSSAPMSFITTLVLAGTATFVMLRWRYETITESMKERLETLKERLTSKDELLDEYRQRLHLTSASGTAYSGLTNRELKSKALELIKSVRGFLHEYHSRDRQTLSIQMAHSRQAATNEERDRLWQLQTNELMKSSLNVNTEYTKRFKVDTILLRDEMIARLPHQLAVERTKFIYEHPTNPLGMEEVVDDLERLAKLLPENTKSA